MLRVLFVLQRTQCFDYTISSLFVKTGEIKVEAVFSIHNVQLLNRRAGFQEHISNQTEELFNCVFSSSIFAVVEIAEELCSGCDSLLFSAQKKVPQKTESNETKQILSIEKNRIKFFAFRMFWNVYLKEYQLFFTLIQLLSTSF